MADEMPKIIGDIHKAMAPLTPEEKAQNDANVELGRELALSWMDQIADSAGSFVVASAANDYFFAMLLIGSDSLITPADAQGHLVGDEERIALHIEAVRYYAAEIRALLARQPKRPHEH